MKAYQYLFISIFSIFLSVSVLYAEEGTPEGDPIRTGIVDESVTAGKYTYLNIREEGKNLWIATMPGLLKVPVAKGDTVEFRGGIEMKDFKSKGMDRTFESILFITRISVNGKSGISLSKDDFHKGNGTEEKKPSPFKEPEAGEIQRGKDDKSIGQILKEKEQLKDRAVTLRAKVMKISKNILKKNWITVKDGTGVAPEDKILVLTTDTAEINDVLTIKGMVKTDVNLGSGYKYKVLLDEAEIIKK